MKKIVAVITTFAVLTAGAGLVFAGAADGEKVFKKKCKLCHLLSDKVSKMKAPGLKGVVGSDGVFGKMHEAYLGKWLKNPKDVNKKAKMPNPKLKPKQIKDVIEYLKTL